MKQRKLKLLKDEKGQAAVEFIMVSVVIFFFLLFYLSLTFAIAISEYIEYATFMAARTYKAAYTDKVNQQDYAQRVFTSYISKLPNSIVQVGPLEFIEAKPGNDLTAGVRATYDVLLFYLPPLFVASDGPLPPSKIQLVSESYLGREPAFNDTLNFMKNFVRSQRLGFDPDSTLIGQMEDNGF